MDLQSCVLRWLVNRKIDLVIDTMLVCRISQDTDFAERRTLNCSQVTKQMLFNNEEDEENWTKPRFFGLLQMLLQMELTRMRITSFFI